MGTGVKLVLAVTFAVTGGVFITLFAFALGFSDAFMNDRAQLWAWLALCVFALFQVALLLGFWQPARRRLLALALGLPAVLLALLLVVLSLLQGAGQALILLGAALLVMLVCLAGASLGARWRELARRRS